MPSLFLIVIHNFGIFIYFEVGLGHNDNIHTVEIYTFVNQQQFSC